jgi:hypothetical protein
MRFFTSKTKHLLPRDAKKSIAPRQEFIAQGKERFLAAFDASALARDARPVTPGRHEYMTAFARVGIGALAVLFIGVGLSAYADTANVPTTSPLYPLKRLSENVQIALAPASEKPQLQATFAVRRADEIAALQAAAPSSTLIPQLTTSLDEDITGSLGATPATGSNDRASDHGYHTSNNAGEATSIAPISAPVQQTIPADVGPITVYCGAFDVSTSGILIGRLEGELMVHPGALQEFNEQCGSESHGQQKVFSATTTIATTTIITIPVPSIIPTAQGKFGTRHRDGL